MVVGLKKETEQQLRMPCLVAMNAQGMTRKHNPATVMDVLVNILMTIFHSVIRYYDNTPNIKQLTACGELGVNGKPALLLAEVALRTGPEQSLSRLCLVAMFAQGMIRKHNPATVMVALVNI